MLKIHATRLKILAAFAAVATTFFLSSPALAADVFFDGKETTLVDVNRPEDSFFGGSDSAVMPATSGTNLTVATQAFDQNVVRYIIGGGLANGALNTVNGDVMLNVSNTSATGIFGGGMASRANVIVNGSVFMNITNSRSASIIGLGREGGGGGSIYVKGSINMNLNNVQLNGRLAGLVGGSRQAIGPQSAMVGGDINIHIENSNIAGGIIAGSFNNDNNIYGNINLTLINTRVKGTISGGFSDTVYGTTTINIFDGSNIETRVMAIGDGKALGPVVINVRNSEVAVLTLGSGSNNQIPGYTNKVTGNVESSQIETINVGVTDSEDNVSDLSILNFSGASKATDIYLGGNIGTTRRAEANIYGGEIENVYMGLNDTYGYSGATNIAILNIYGGSIDDIKVYTTDYSAVHFKPNGNSISHIKKDLLGYNDEELNDLVLEKGAKTRWGTDNAEFQTSAKNITLAGEIFYSTTSEIDLFVVETLTLSGGSLVPQGLDPNQREPSVAFVDGGALIGLNPSRLIINKPLDVILSYSPELVGAVNIPIAYVDTNFLAPDFFEPRNTRGIIWSDSFLNRQEQTWYITNIRPSEDYYGLSAAREGSSWIRQEHILSVQTHAGKTLSKNKDGLWLEVQGGREKLDSAVGNAKMPWFMATLGYDCLQPFSLMDVNFKALCGLSVGFSRGINKWSSINTTKNFITSGIANAYLGLMHDDSGVYATVSGQFTATRIKTDSSGFDANYKWRENIPTEAAEIGWHCNLGEGFSINPRGKIILEQISSHTFKLKYDNDKAELKKSALITTVAGISAEYAFLIDSASMGIEAGVDWIKGLSGDFAAKSKVMNISFKDKNDSSVIRASIGINAQVTDDIGLSLNGFVDMGDDKGFGGHLNATYTF